MATERLPMRKIREILRLRRQQGLSVREAARALGVSVGVVSKTSSRAERTGISWEVAEGLSDVALEERMYGRAAGPNDARPRPNPVYLHTEFRRPGVTLELLHLEYLEQHPTGLRYTAFCEDYRKWLAKTSVTMRQLHRAAEKCFVDFSGVRHSYRDRATGEQVFVEIFVAVLGASNLTYAEGVLSQKVGDFIGAHIGALSYFGGVPDMLVPDCLKAAVTVPCRYEPGIQRTYAEFARHYGTAVVPARPYKARDKAKVEVAVQIAQRWILARLRNETFFSLKALNKRIRVLVDELNARPMKKLGGVSRRELFDRVERGAMRPLPSTAYECAEWLERTVNADYHVEVDKHWYSPSAVDMPTANNDTTYLSAVVDLSSEPYILSVADVGDRYYVVDVFDMWQELQHYIGRRTTGTKAGRFALVPPGWKGVLPAGTKRLDVATSKVWLWGRLRVSPGEDMNKIHALQDAFDLRPLSAFGNQRWAAPAATLSPLPEIGTDPLGFYRHLGAALKDNPIRTEDKALAEQFARIGLTAKGFDPSKLNDSQRKGLLRAIQDAPFIPASAVAQASEVREGWNYVRGLDSFGFDYPLRAVVAGPYLGGQGEKEAVYPLRYTDNQGKPLTGSNDYVVRFPAEPPNDAFWSLTIYDAKTKMLIKNSIDRYKFGSDTPGIQRNGDGSFTVTVSPRKPTDGSNWLPAPNGPFYAILRVYQPRPEIISGTWKLPQMERVQKQRLPVWWAFGVCGLPLCCARAPVLCGVRSRGRQRDPDTSLQSASPRSPRSAMSEGRSRGHGSSRGRRLMGAAGAWGLPASPCRSRSRTVTRGFGRRGGSSTSPTAEREPRGSSARLREGGARLVGTSPVEFAPATGCAAVLPRATILVVPRVGITAFELFLGTVVAGNLVRIPRDRNDRRAVVGFVPLISNPFACGVCTPGTFKNRVGKANDYRAALGGTECLAWARISSALLTEIATLPKQLSA